MKEYWVQQYFKWPHGQGLKGLKGKNIPVFLCWTVVAGTFRFHGQEQTMMEEDKEAEIRKALVLVMEEEGDRAVSDSSVSHP